MHAGFIVSVLFVCQNTGKMFVRYNPNPDGRNVGDCTVRALCKALSMSWERVYAALCAYGLKVYDMPSSNAVWGLYLSDRGFVFERLQNECPYCYTIADFCAEHPRGTYVLGTGTHVVCVVDGDYYDAWDSGDKIPIYSFRKEY